MSGTELDHIRYRLSRSGETLREAELLSSAGFTTGVVNRIYYACFYAVWALLMTEGYSSSKHSGVMSLFNKHWIGPERLPKEMGRFYRIMFDERQQGDYEEIAEYEPGEIIAWLAEARVFVEQIKCWIVENKGIDLS